MGNREAGNTIDFQAIISAIEKEPLRLRVVFMEALQRSQILRANPAGVFHLNGAEGVGAVQDKVDLCSGGCAPEREIARFVPISDPGLQVLSYETLQGCARDGLRLVHGT